MEWRELFSIDNLTLIGTILGSVVGSLLIFMNSFKKSLKKYMENNRENVSTRIKKQSEIDTNIYNRMEHLKEILNADRIQIYEFHNGIHYANGRSALRTTCTYEVCRYGIKPCQAYMKAVPLSCIPNFIRRLLDDGKIVVKDLKDIEKTMPSTYALKNSQNIKSFYDIIIKNEVGEPIGFVAIQFCENEYNIDEIEISRFVGFLEETLANIL